MARDVAERELIKAPAGRTQFEIATDADDEQIRRLLRHQPMSGRISISTEREPTYFADARLPDETKQTIVARSGSRVVCVGSCTFGQRFVNGEPRRVGYLGGLRLDAAFAGRFDIVRRGYEFFRETQASAPADFYFTTIAADNHRARRLLERGLPGLPGYEFIGEFATVLLPTSRRTPEASQVTQTVPTAAQLVALLNEHNRQQQLSLCCSTAQWLALEPLGLRLNDFEFIHEGGQLVACAALWDQRTFKQTVVRGYARSLALARPALNAIARLAGGARLPAVGEPIANAFVAWLATASPAASGLVQLMARLRTIAARRGIELLTLGFGVNDPRLATVRGHFRCREYRTRLYLVRWPGCGGAAQELDGRILAPEAASL